MSYCDKCAEKDAQLEAVTKERDGLFSYIKLPKTVPMSYDELFTELFTLKADYKKALEALNLWNNANWQSVVDFSVLRKATKEVLSLPSATEIMKEGKV